MNIKFLCIVFLSCVLQGAEEANETASKSRCKELCTTPEVPAESYEKCVVLCRRGTGGLFYSAAGR